MWTSCSLDYSESQIKSFLKWDGGLKCKFQKKLSERGLHRDLVGYQVFSCLVINPGAWSAPGDGPRRSTKALYSLCSCCDSAIKPGSLGRARWSWTWGLSGDINAHSRYGPCVWTRQTVFEELNLCCQQWLEWKDLALVTSEDGLVKQSWILIKMLGLGFFLIHWFIW